MSPPPAHFNVPSAIEGDVLGTRYIEELLALVDGYQAEDPTERLVADRDRLRGEIDRLLDSVALGISARSIAPKVRSKEDEITRIEAKLRMPRPVQPNIEKLGAALEQRAEAWRQDLHAEPKMARALLRRLIGPLEMKDLGPKPDFIVEWEAKTRPEGMLQDLVQDPEKMVSPTGFEPVLLP